MKKLALLALLALTPLLYAEPKLILHFDVNGTIMAADSVGNKAPEETLIQSLAEDVYGYWGTHSYAEHLSQLYPGEENKHERRKHLNRLIQVMEEKGHPRTEGMKAEVAALMGQISEGAVFPSFYRLIDYLEERDISYTIHLRTFGGDTQVVSRDIEARLGKPLFSKRLWSAAGGFKDDKGPLPLHVAYQTFCEENVAGQEDWSHWLANKKAAGTGKPFPIDVNDIGTVSIFFDDHIQPGDSPTNIVTPVDLEGHPLDIDTLIGAGQLCPVDTLEAIRDPDYFIKKVAVALHGDRQAVRQ